MPLRRLLSTSINFLISFTSLLSLQLSWDPVSSLSSVFASSSSSSLSYSLTSSLFYFRRETVLLIFFIVDSFPHGELIFMDFLRLFSGFFCSSFLLAPPSRLVVPSACTCLFVFLLATLRKRLLIFANISPHVYLWNWTIWLNFRTHPLLDGKNTKTDNFNSRIAAIQRPRPF